MRKLVSLGAVLLFLFGIAFLARPAVALPLCDCEFCPYFPNTLCYYDEGGYRLSCYEYTSSYCFGLSASTEKKVASEPVFFPLELLGVPAPDGRLYPSLPVVKPGC